jgi:hypothetical protein
VAEIVNGLEQAGFSRSVFTGDQVDPIDRLKVYFAQISKISDL